MQTRTGVRLFEDRSVRLATTPSTLTVRDEFNTAVYSNNDGTVDWAGDWVQIGEDGEDPAVAATSGNVRVGEGALLLSLGNHGAWRKVDLFDANSAVLSFDFRRRNFGAVSDWVAVQISMDNGISWIELGRFTGPANDSGFQAASFDLSPYVSGFLTTRFITSASNALTKARFYVDNVQVSHTDHRPYTNYPQLVDAADLHLENTLGSGVTIAVVDTGYWAHPDIAARPEGAARALLLYDAMQNVGLSALPTSMVNVSYTADESGHGSHVTSIALNGHLSPDGRYSGVAPDANLVSVRAFDATGRGAYSDVIRGIDFVVTHKDEFNVKVLNLSFSAPPQSYYWEDPLNQAVMRAWQAGIVVVAAAGNSGPDPMTIGVPGNVPVCHHRRRHDRQLHPGRRLGRFSGFLFRRRTHRRGLCQARPARPRRAHARVDAGRLVPGYHLP